MREQAGLCGLREMIKVWVCGGSMWAWCGDQVSEDKARLRQGHHVNRTGL